jgi:hypothetical protein
VHPGQLVTLCLNFLFWTITYGLIIQRQWKMKSAGIPLQAICIMTGFEFSYLFVFGLRWGGDSLQKASFVFELIWFLLDMTIFMQVVRYGARSEPSQVARLHHKLISVATLLFTTAGVATFVALFELQQSGMFAFIDEMAVSVFYLYFVARHRQLAGLSVAGLWTRTAADLCLAVALVICSPWCDIWAPDAARRCA